MYLTPKEIAERFKISERHATHLAKSGILPAIKIGRLWRFPTKDIEIWEEHQGIDRAQINNIVKEILNDNSNVDA